MVDSRRGRAILDGGVMEYEKPVCFAAYGSTECKQINSCPVQMDCRRTKMTQLCNSRKCYDKEGCVSCEVPKLLEPPLPPGVLRIVKDSSGQNHEIWEANALLRDVARIGDPVYAVMKTKDAKCFHQHCSACNEVLTVAEEIGAEYVLLAYPSKLNGGRVPDVIAVLRC